MKNNKQKIFLLTVNNNGDKINNENELNEFLNEGYFIKNSWPQVVSASEDDSEYGGLFILLEKD